MTDYLDDDVLTTHISDAAALSDADQAAVAADAAELPAAQHTPSVHFGAGRCARCGGYGQSGGEVCWYCSGSGVASGQAC